MVSNVGRHVAEVLRTPWRTHVGRWSNYKAAVAARTQTFNHVAVVK